MRKLVVVVSALLLCLSTSSAFAEGMTVGFGGGLASPISPSEFKDGFDPHVSVGGYLLKNFNTNLGVRAEAGFDRVSDNDIDFDTTRIAGGVQITRPGNFEFFGFATLGAFVKKLSTPSLDLDSETDLGVSLGAGMNTFFGDAGWGLGTEVRFNIAMRDEDRDALKSLVTQIQLIKRF